MLSLIIHHLKSLFHECEYREVKGSWKDTGQMTVDWGLNYVPMYSTEEKCTCGRTRKRYWTSLADINYKRDGRL